MRRNGGKIPTTRRLLLPFFIALLSTIVAFCLSRDVPFDLPFLRTAELRTLDQRFELRGPIPLGDTSKVVIVALTDQTFQTLPNTLYFPRSYYARVIRNLYEAGARVVAVDVMFDERSQLKGDDRALARVLKRYPSTVLAVRNTISESGRYVVLKSSDFFHNIFIKYDSAMGVVFVRNDQDGEFRRYMPRVDFRVGENQFRAVPSFGLAAISQYLGLGDRIATDGNTHFRLGGIRIPKYDPSSFLINYVGPSRSFPTYDIADVIDDSSFTTGDEERFGEQINYYYELKKSGVFRNKIVLIGAEYPESGDLKPVPFLKDASNPHSNQIYGVELHANAIETVLDRNFLRPTSAAADFLIMFAGAFLIAITSFLFKSARHSRMFLVIFTPLVVTATVVFVAFEASLMLFIRHNVVFDIVYPTFAFSLTYVSVVVYQFVSERRAKTAMKSLFSRYVDPSVVNELVGNPDLVRLGGERKRLTVLFSDIAGFTSVSEKLVPEELVAHLNDYLTSMTEVVFQNSGTLDKYIGDAIIAFWGAPLEVVDHEYQACRTAMEMTRRLDALHSKWIQEGKPILNFRIGINTGEMIVGNVGGRDRFDYTVIGDNVNLASRLESANKMYHSRILMSEYTYEKVKDRVFARELDLIVVKGKTKPVKIFELISDNPGSVGDDKRKFVSLYCEGISRYRNREWENAKAVFEKALSIDPADYPSEMYLERCMLYEVDPPPENWDGVFVMTTK